MALQIRGEKTYRPGVTDLTVNAVRAQATASAKAPSVSAVTFMATNITDTSINLAWTPANATVTEIGRDGFDSLGGGPWNGVPSDLPFQLLIPNTTYDLHAVINGVRYDVLATTAASAPPTGGTFGFAEPQLPGRSAAEQDAWLSDMVSMGMSWVRFDMSWGSAQPTSANTFQWGGMDSIIQKCNNHGVKVLATLLYVPGWVNADKFTVPSNTNLFATFAAAAVSHFGSAVGAYEIWNEPNTSTFWHPSPNIPLYTQTLIAAAAAMRSVDPNVKIITAGCAPAATGGGTYSPVDFVTGIYNNGGKNSCTAIGHHPYCCPSDYATPHPWSAWTQIADTSPSLRSVMAANGDSAKNIWVTEAGGPTNGPNGTAGLSTCTNQNYGGTGPFHYDDCMQSRVLTELVQQTKALSYIEMAFPYQYQDLGTSTSTVENFFGVRNNSGVNKPSYTALKNAIAAP